MIANDKKQIQDFTARERLTLHPAPDKDHPNYRLELEVLARIPLLSRQVRAKAIAADLKVAEHRIEGVLDRLRVDGFRIVTTISADGILAGMSIVSWSKAQSLTKSYLGDVYAAWTCSDVVTEERTPSHAS